MLVKWPIWTRIPALILALMAAGCGSQTEGSPDAEDRLQPPEGVIVAMGDSLTEGFGLPEADSYPSVLQQMLTERDVHWRVVNAGISGETSSGARSRLDWVMKLKPDIVILETGANDALRGVPPENIFENIDAIVTELKARSVTVVLAGMKIHPNFGPEYSRNFADIYERVAREHDIIRMPFFLEGVAGRSELNRADGLHPNASGYREVARQVLPHVLDAIERHRSQGAQEAGKITPGSYGRTDPADINRPPARETVGPTDDRLP
jgi:acyl-CoA thioesterase-1